MNKVLLYSSGQQDNKSINVPVNMSINIPIISEQRSHDVTHLVARSSVFSSIRFSSSFPMPATSHKLKVTLLVADRTFPFSAEFNLNLTS